MSANNSANVSTGKPKIGGAIYYAPEGTPLPTDAVSNLNASFENLGYVSEDGLTNANSITSENIKAWGGDIVNSTQTEKGDTFAFKLIEVIRVAVLKAIYGSDNVTGELDTGIQVKANAKEIKAASWVVDMILNGSTLKRVVIPRGKISELGDIVYKDDEAIGYEPTIEALPDTDGNTHYEYIKGSEVVSA